MKKENKIICPVCGRQYLPGEIFIPKYLVGQPFNIEKDRYGKIIFHEGLDMNFEEDYKCDNCNTDLKISCDMKFFAKVDNNKNPDLLYTTKLKTGLNLKED